MCPLSGHLALKVNLCFFFTNFETLKPLFEAMTPTEKMKKPFYLATGKA